MWGLALFLRQNPLRFRRRDLVTLIALGAVFYTAQSLTYFTALRSLPASLCVLIAYIYPSLVVLAGWLFLRRSVSAWHGVALIASFLGVALLVGGAHFQIAWALVFAIASPTIYTGYILLGERVMGSVPAVGASAVIVSGAAIAFCIIAAFTGELALPVTAQGWAVGFAIALIPTMQIYMPRVNTVLLLAVVLLGDRLSLVQVVGGVLVLLAVGVVQSASLWKRSAPSAIK